MTKNKTPISDADWKSFTQQPRVECRRNGEFVTVYKVFDRDGRQVGHVERYGSGYKFFSSSDYTSMPFQTLHGGRLLLKAAGLTMKETE